MQDIIARDAEDDSKLAEGIAMAVKKGAVPPAEELPLERVHDIDVLGLSADQVAASIVAALGDAPSTGCVLVLQGLSGTGKGTTVAKLQQLLPNASTVRRREGSNALRELPALTGRVLAPLPQWSNGNIFRSLTLLAVTYFESHGLAFSAEALSPSLLSELISMLHFDQVSPKSAAGPPVFDVRIDGLGIRAMVSQVANTLLKDPKVGKNIPSVARVTQGEVIAFAARCAEKMRASGMNVLMEGARLPFATHPRR